MRPTKEQQNKKNTIGMREELTLVRANRAKSFVKRYKTSTGL
jgi:hypothetical protein